jgi:transposase
VRPPQRTPKARRLTEGEEATLAAVILRGPKPERDGCCAWTRADLCRWMAAHFGKSYHPSSMTRVLRRMGFSRQKARPAHPQRDETAQQRFQKRGCAPP